ncbi:MFS transporter [Kitasatospora sp. SolWspMP-SS2h]|uniref:MFS transporter n=1 Tax=Kitasatospora sp. SolWspMP-SS2h TaxID=1305729 RepID=UPI000DB95DFE|nr:MFS transporter [Kitasatospora sp. SolWspMP-SS2h]RAJ38458.1 MFS transporter [Kitasatospora sp. SolWspMP-SS2h]
MYLTDTRPGASLKGAPARRVLTGNVLALGLVSLVTDVSSEMVTAVLPAYLVLGLHLGVAQYGAFDGLYTGATALTRLAGGYLADRLRRRKLVAAVGYGLSALAKVGLLLTPAAPAAVGAVLAADRTGKGLRTAPRDALITLSAPREQLGRAFGAHRALDSLGAFAGPIVALGVLALAGGAGRSWDAVFVTSLCFALLGVLLLALFVRDRGQPLPPGAASPRAALALLKAGPLRAVCAGAALLGLATVGDGFVYLLLQHRDDLPLTAFPLLAVGTAGAYLVLAPPLGRLADRIGRRPVALGGYGALLAVYLLLATGRGPLWAVLLLYGAFYAATDGVLMALAGPLTAPELRTTGLALVQTCQALAYLVSSLLFGLAWQHLGSTTACLAAAAAAAAATAAATPLLGGTTR